MLIAIKTAWPLLIGMFMLMIGNGMQGTVLGIRGAIESFDATTMGFVMSGYFVGFLGGAQVTPGMIQRVGHIRVFAALASLISAAFVLFPAIVDPWAWMGMRILIGFCFSGLYITAESWLNDSATNDNRGQILSAYMLVQMAGIIIAQGLLNVADPGGYNLFIIMSVLVSVSMTPILLSASRAPTFDTARRMTLRKLFETSPLGCVSIFLLGAVFSCLWGMGAVYGAEIGLTTGEISLFVAAVYVGGLVAQYPIGWISDRSDRRRLIAAVTAAGALGALIGAVSAGSFPLLLLTAVIVGGAANPLYSLIIAHTNDFLEHEDMASASAGLIFLNGVGAAGTPILVGWLMDTLGAQSFMVFILGAMGLTTAYALYRMTKRPAMSAQETAPQAMYGPMATNVTVAELAQDWVVEQSEDQPAAPARA